MKDIKNYTLDELKEFLRKRRYPSFCAEQIFGWIYKKRKESFALMTNISYAGREFLKDNFYFSKIKLLEKEKSLDGTEKFLFSLEDKSCIETVLIPENERSTLCLSTQVGCKFGCKFCLSGKDGFKRNLEASEIINQYLSVRDLIGSRKPCTSTVQGKITNIVFMGVGEPLDNFSNTIRAVKIFIEPQGLHFSRRRICISTCGIIPQIKKLNDLNLGIKLSISLHTPNDFIRSKIMPINKKYPLKSLIKTVKEFSRPQRYPVTFEYVLIRGLNTEGADAHKLARLLKGINYKMNLIPSNYSHSVFKPPSRTEIDAFKRQLKKEGVFFTLRKSRGQDINAACGQLRASYKETKDLEPKT